MTVEFCTRSKKTFGKEIEHKWAEISLGGHNEEEFVFNQYLPSFTLDGEIPILVFNDGDYVEIWEKPIALKELNALCQKNRFEAVLVCDDLFFREAVRNSEKDELEAHLLITEDRSMLYYATIGQDKCALLVAYDE